MLTHIGGCIWVKTKINILHFSDLNRRAMLEEQVQMRLAIDNKALQIVERLLDNPITEDFLVDCVRVNQIIIKKN